MRTRPKTAKLAYTIFELLWGAMLILSITAGGVIGFKEFGPWGIILGSIAGAVCGVLMILGAVFLLKRLLAGADAVSPSKRARFSKKVKKILTRSGWTADRDEPGLEARFQEVLGSDWVPAAGPFVRSFGELAIGDSLWINAKDHLRTLLPLKERMRKFIRCNACPVSAVNYMGDESMLWIDERGRFYAVDSEGMVFLGERVEEALEVLIDGKEPGLAPVDIRNEMLAAYNWGVQS